jgi:hypothetical protein
MSTKLIATCMTLATFAVLATASTASAKPVLTQPTGTVLAAGTNVTAINIGEVVFTTSLGNITCSTGTLAGKVTKNSTTDGFEANVEATTFAGSGEQAAGEPDKECTSWSGGVSVTPNPPTNGLPWCIKAVEANDNLQIRGNSCASAARPIRLTFPFTSTFILTCTYQRIEPLNGSIRTDLTGGEDAVGSLTQQEFTKVEGGAGCPSTGKLDLTFTLSANGSAVFASS